VKIKIKLVETYSPHLDCHLYPFIAVRDQTHNDLSYCDAVKIDILIRREAQKTVNEYTDVQVPSPKKLKTEDGSSSYHARR
jgi:hypothetical protein